MNGVLAVARLHTSYVLIATWVTIKERGVIIIHRANTIGLSATHLGLDCNS